MSANNNNTTTTGDISSLTMLSSFKVHPTVLLSCTDHHSRAMRENAKHQIRQNDEKNEETTKNALGCAGLLLGHHWKGGGEIGGGEKRDFEKAMNATAGGNGGGDGGGSSSSSIISIASCFEIEYRAKKEEGGETSYVVDEEFVHRMRKNYKQTFADLDVVGWYFCSVFNDSYDDDDEREDRGEDKEAMKAFQKQAHEQIRECVKDVVDCPMVLLTVDAKVHHQQQQQQQIGGKGKENEDGEKGDGKQKKRAALPAKLYRYEETDQTFKQIAYGIDASSAERLASDHASKAAEKAGELETKESRVLAYLMEQRVSVKALRDRVGTMLEFLEKEVAGENDGDELRFEILRRLNAICAQKDTQLPNEEKANREKSDAALIEMLTKLTKACADTESFARKFNAAYKKEDIESSSGGLAGVGGSIDDTFFGGGLMERFDHRIPAIAGGAPRRKGEGATASLRSRRQQAAAANNMQID